MTPAEIIEAMARELVEHKVDPDDSETVIRRLMQRFSPLAIFDLVGRAVERAREIISSSLTPPTAIP